MNKETANQESAMENMQADTGNPDNSTETGQPADGQAAAAANAEAEAQTEFLKNVYLNGYAALKTYFDDVEGQIQGLQHYGPVFLYRVKDKDGDLYACGFLLRELVAKFQGGGDPAQWMASFFFELMKTKGGKELPSPPTNEDEVKALIDKTIVPHCIESIREEFSPEQVHIGLAWNEQFGPVLEAGFPAITDGNNVCASPLQLLLTHYQMNRDPAEVLVNGLYTIQKENGIE